MGELKSFLKIICFPRKKIDILTIGKTSDEKLLFFEPRCPTL